MKISCEMLKSKFENFIIIDIRPKQSFEAARLKNALNLQTQDEILAFLQRENLSEKTPLVICFSETKSKKLAKVLSQKLNLDVGFLEGGFVRLDVSEFGEFLTENETTLFSNQNHESNLAEATREKIRDKFLKTTKTFIVAYSGGKDSTCVLQLVYEMLLSLPPNLRRQTFAICSNTLVEPPHIEAYIKKTLCAINAHAKANSVPFEVLEVSPSIENDFWLNLIGKGYPSPTRTFRWCTERLKINPTKDIVEKIARDFSPALLCLGVRKLESTNRKKSIEKRELNEDGFNKHDDFANTMTFSPIAEWSTDDVWAYLLQKKAPWGSHDELFSLYAKASGEECQFITNLNQSSCGGSRFGCWVCTLVNEDKSMQGFIKSGEEKLRPLNDFRNYIKEIREKPEFRSNYRRNGDAVFKLGRFGPFTNEARVEIFRELLRRESEFRRLGGEVNLISDEQILAIDQTWKDEFDLFDRAITIAKEYGRMKNESVKSGEILHAELLKDGKYVSGDELRGLVKQSIEISDKFSNVGRWNSGSKIADMLRNFVEDKTQKEQ